MISAEPGEVFDNDTIDQTGLHLIHHLPKGRTVKIQSGASVVDLNAAKFDVLFLVEIIHDNAQLDAECIAGVFFYTF